MGLHDQVSRTLNGDLTQEMGESTSLEKWLEAKSLPVMIALLFALLVLYAAFSPGGVPLGETDAGWYITTATNILKGQDNFFELMYHKGFPLILSPVIYIWGYDFLAMHILIIAFALSSIGLCYLLLKNLEDKKLALLIVFLIGIHPTFVDSTRYVLTEMPRFFFILAGLFATEKYVADKRVLSKWLLVGSFSLCACYLIKHSAVAVIAAAVLRLLFVDYRKAILLGLMPVILISLSASSVFDFSYYYLFEREHRLIGDRSTFWKFLLDVIKGFPLRILRASDLIFYDFAILLRQKLQLWASLSASIIIFPVIIGWIRHWLKQRTVMEFYVPLYIGILVIYPIPWPRYWIYITPFLLLYFFSGTSVLAAWVSQPKRRGMRFKTTVLTTIVLLIISLSAVGNIQTYIQVRKAPISAEWSEFMKTCDWIKQNTPTKSHVMAYLHYWVSILADRPGYPISETVDPVEQMQWIEEQKAHYLIVQNIPGYDLKFLIPVLEKYPYRFQLVYKTGHTRLYQAIPPR